MYLYIIVEMHEYIPPFSSIYFKILYATYHDIVYSSIIILYLRTLNRIVLALARQEFVP
jgi:hypothetical protein